MGWGGRGRGAALGAPAGVPIAPKNNMRGRTLIMITHRLAPLAIADRVAVVMDGRIERVGPPTEIMAYARIRMAEATRDEER